MFSSYKSFLLFLIVSLALSSKCHAATTGAMKKYFGYYGDDLSVTGKYSNLFIQAYSIPQATEFYNTYSVPSLLVVTDVFFTWNNLSQPILNHNYLQLWRDFIINNELNAAIKNGTILGFNLGDELVFACMPIFHLELMANTVRISYPKSTGVIIWYNEASPVISQGRDYCGHTFKFHIPAALDWFSTDIYHMDGVESNFVSIEVVSYYETYIFPTLKHQNQKAVLIPGSFGSYNNAKVCDNFCYDLMCSYDAHDFYEWASTDDRIVALFPWNWIGCPNCPVDDLGTKDMPLTKLAWSLLATNFTQNNENTKPNIDIDLH